MRVDFMIIGAQKCGTSTLFKILDAHPNLVGSRPKELDFFSLSPDWQRELPRYERYFQQPQNSSHQPLYFEASPSYTFYPGGGTQPAWDRKYPIRNLRIWDDIFAYNPAMKLIYLVRNPVDRVVSSYLHHYSRGYTNRSLEEAIRHERIFIDVTRYHTQINPYLKKFGPENVLILDFDDLIQNRTQVLQAIAHFLSIDFEGFSDYENIHANPFWLSRNHHKFDSLSRTQRIIRKLFPSLWQRMTDNSERLFREKPKLSWELQEMILTMLELEIGALQTLMNKDLSHWLSVDSSR